MRKIDLIRGKQNLDKNSKLDIPFLKIIYFDEESATDLIYMKNKGQIIESIADNSTSGSTSDVKAEAEISSKDSVLSLLGAKFGFGVSSSITYGSEQLINQAITNTVLTDYLKLSNLVEKIIKFKNSTVKPNKNSLSYYKILTPYLVMTDGSMETGELKLNVQLMDEAIRKGKGYYELILTDSENKTKVLRFNLKSFKNSYSLTDLVKMELTYHAVKVGSINLDDLEIEKEFSFQEQTYVDGTELAGESSKMETSKVDVFDVLLAGVEND